MANRNYASGGKIYSQHVKMVIVDAHFTVAATNGLGISSLAGPLVQNVFMHTSTTPAAGNSNPATPNIVITNPNPASGTIVVQLQDNYNKILGFSSSITAPTSGSALKIDNAALTAGVAYSISTLGDATAAQWIALGVPRGITPAVGVNFIAAATGSGSGNVSTSRVMAAAAAGSGVCSIEAVTNNNLSIAPLPSVNQGFGAQILLQCRDYAGALVAPVDGSVIRLMIYLSDSSVPSGGNET